MWRFLNVARPPAYFDILTLAVPVISQKVALVLCFQKMQYCYELIEKNVFVETTYVSTIIFLALFQNI